MFAAGPARTPQGFLGGGVRESSVLCHGAMVSIIMLIPANTLSISLSTRPTSDLRNSCKCWSSDVNPLRLSIELDVNRATEDLICSALFSIFGMYFGTSCSSSLLISASISDSTGGDFSASAGGIGAFIVFPMRGLSNLDPHDISNPVNKCLGGRSAKQSGVL
jgi:hypothetical protein